MLHVVQEDVLAPHYSNTMTGRCVSCNVFLLFFGNASFCNNSSLHLVVCDNYSTLTVLHYNYCADSTVRSDCTTTTVQHYNSTKVNTMMLQGYDCATLR